MNKRVVSDILSRVNARTDEALAQGGDLVHQMAWLAKKCDEGALTRRQFQRAKYEVAERWLNAKRGLAPSTAGRSWLLSANARGVRPPASNAGRSGHGLPSGGG